MPKIVTITKIMMTMILSCEPYSRYVQKWLRVLNEKILLWWLKRLIN